MSQLPKPMFYVGECPVCATGPLGLRRCGDCGKIVLLCDECDSVWADANTTAQPMPASEDDLPCPLCGGSLCGKHSRWAIEADLAACDWLSAAVQAGRLEIKRGQAFAPSVNDPDFDANGETPDDG